MADLFEQIKEAKNLENIVEPMKAAIHHWFCMVSYDFKWYEDYITVTLPHLVGFKPFDEETRQLDYQKDEVIDNVKAVIKTSNLKGLTYDIKPNGHTEDGKDWYQFEVTIKIPIKENTNG